MPVRDQEAQQLLLRFGQRVRELRTSRDLSQADLAHLANLHPTYVSGIERGTRNVSLINMATIARALRIDLDQLVATL